MLGAAAPVSAAGFTSGDIVVVRVGDGTAALSGVVTAVFLDEYNASGTLVQSIASPTSGAGANRRVTVSGSATTEGARASADGRYLSLGGYDADPGTASVVGTSATTVPRVVTRVDAAGVVDSSTAITDAFSTNNIRGVVTDDGNRSWAVGSNGGVRLVALGSTGATTQINSAPTNLRVGGHRQRAVVRLDRKRADGGVRRRIGPTDHRGPDPDRGHRGSRALRVRRARRDPRRTGHRHAVRGG